jgi:hypothetical protein
MRSELGFSLRSAHGGRLEITETSCRQLVPTAAWEPHVRNCYINVKLGRVETACAARCSIEP